MPQRGGLAREGLAGHGDCYSPTILNSAVSPTSAALVVAHPGHELRVHGWLERARPIVFVLTDGSGRGASRLESTTRLLAAAGATPGSIYGRFSDREIYSALLAGETERFVEVAAELAEALREAGIQIVAGDALEGFNPGHDLCRLLIDAAVARLARDGRAVRNLQFPLEEHPTAETGENGPTDLALDLDDPAFARKLAAARSYPEMAGEVEAALARFGPAAFRREHLAAAVTPPLAALYEQTPFFERHGERRVAEGHYRAVLRGREHLVPVASALARWAAESD
ncbi:MAG TPA: hypothetical protein VGS22_22700 [Thermoanaerobaculia bacterium]|nr:hypothetical protein [Thermoanaerobaculia bacterium]